MTVHRRPDRVVILEGEADAVDRSNRDQRREDQAARAEEIDRAGAHLGEQIAIAPELAIWEHPDIDLQHISRFQRVLGVSATNQNCGAVPFHEPFLGLSVGALQLNNKKGVRIRPSKLLHHAGDRNWRVHGEHRRGMMCQERGRK